MPPDQCLRSLTAEALLSAQPGRDLLPDSLGVMATEHLTVTVSTLWEAAWADVDLPGRTT